MKFAHIADTHIRNLKYHKEYREVFSQLYKKLRELEVDYIIHCGDIAHTKTQISPEFVEMCSDFFKNLADIAPTYIILGNHDGNLRNSSRQDALTPIAAALNHKNLNLLKNSGEVKIKNNWAGQPNFCLNVLSVFDRDNWSKPTEEESINIALYHGAISNSKTDTGWSMEHGEDSVSIFDDFDYAFLGDIHKTNQSLDKKGKIRYCGSTVQQNHGETNDKGFLLWDIESKDKFTCEHHILENPKPFLTIKLTPKGRLPSKLKIKNGARVRLLSQNNLPLDVIRKAVDVVKSRFSPEAVTYLSRAQGERGSVEEIAHSLRQKDLRDLAVQEELIEQYLLDFQPDDNTLKKVYEMNKKYNASAEKEEEVRRNINWKLKKLEWDNLFNYGESNSINFENVAGVVGILGKNFSGKSSIIDSFLYTLYNTTSKNNRKNLNLINQNEDSCRGYVEIDVGTKTYKVLRTSKKYKKKLKGKVTWEAKTDVDFDVLDQITGEESSLNGVTRIETDNNIRKFFGTVDDFLLTSMSSQLDSLSYLNEGSTKRKEILAKFLDLEFFDKKFKMCNEDSVDLKGAIKNLSGVDYDEKIKDARTDLARSQAELSVKERLTDETETKYSKAFSELEAVKQEIDAIPNDIVECRNSNDKIDKCEKTISELLSEKEEKQAELEKNKEFLEKIDNFLNGFDVESFNSKKELIESEQRNLLQIEKDIESFEESKKRNENKIFALKKAPCSHDLREKCHFVKDARRALDDTKRVKISLNQLTLSRTTITNKINDLNPKKVNKYIEKYYMVLEKKTALKELVTSLELNLEKSKVKLIQLESLLTDLKKNQLVFEQNKKLVDRLQDLLEEKDKLTKAEKALDKTLQKSRKMVLDLYKSVGSLEQGYENILERKDEFENLQDEFTTADLFLKCMHPNGISYDIIKKRLPQINAEISKILTNIVDFEVFFENDEKKLDILIKHQKHPARPIEMGSGAEKTIAAMAIRLALLNVSTLPKGDVFILDEPGTALDAENMEGFIRILEMIKNQFKTVLLISHLDSLKDTVDSEIAIEKIHGRAFVSE